MTVAVTFREMTDNKSSTILIYSIQGKVIYTENTALIKKKMKHFEVYRNGKHLIMRAF
jgi:hypothetical protein